MILVVIVILAVLAALYFLAIMPRLFRKPERAPFLGRLYAHRGLHGSPESSQELLFKDKRNTRKTLSHLKTDMLLHGRTKLLISVLME